MEPPAPPSTLAGDITIGNLSFSAANYTITTSANRLLTLDAATPTIFVDTGRTATISTRLTSTGEILKTGDGTLVITGNNESSSGMTINAGTLVAAKSAQDNGIHTLGSGPLTINNGGTLRSTVNWATSSEWNGTHGRLDHHQPRRHLVDRGHWSNHPQRPVSERRSITATVSNADWGALHLKSGVTAGDGVTSTIAADTALSGTQTITVDIDSQLNYSGLIHNQYGTTSGITKEGDGTLVFTGTKTYTGPTTVNFGTLQLGDGTTNGSTPGSAITNNASLVVNPAGSQRLLPDRFRVRLAHENRLRHALHHRPPKLHRRYHRQWRHTRVAEQQRVRGLRHGNNAGFETPDYRAPNWNYLGNDGVSGGWSFTGGGIGSNGSPWLTTAPEGDQAGFIQINGTISQTITSFRWRIRGYVQVGQPSGLRGHSL